MARSRYARSKVLDRNHYETFSTEHVNWVKEHNDFSDVSFIEYVVKSGDRLDTLSARYLNDDKYWWAIALINNLVLPTISPGQKIKIPTNISEILDRV